MSCLSDGKGLDLFGRSMMRKFSWMLLLLLTVSLWAVEGEKVANHAPVVTNVVAKQVEKRVEITYDLDDADGDLMKVELLASSDGGNNFNLPVKSVEGDIGEDIYSGKGKTIIWHIAVDIPDFYSTNAVFEVLADDGVDRELSFISHDIATQTPGEVSVSAVDFDGDGDVDVLSSSRGDGRVDWYENNGSQSFSSHIIALNGWGNAEDFHAADIDADWDIDVLVALWLSRKIAWYENDGAENFTEHVISISSTNSEGTTERAKSVYAVDVNGDGHLEFIAGLDDGSAPSNNNLAWYENDGAENFTEHVITTDYDEIGSVYAADIDGDNDIDFLSSAHVSNIVAWYENDGSQNFTPHTIASNASASSHSRAIHAADVNGDGYIDVISPSSINTISWYQNDGSGNFTINTFNVSNIPMSVYGKDLDGDRDVDIIAAIFDWPTSTNDKIAWYENAGAENFKVHELRSSTQAPQSIFPVDLDGDGDIDLINGGASDGKIVWYENQ